MTLVPHDSHQNQERITLEDSERDIIVKLAEGNPGAISAIMALRAVATRIDPDSAFEHLTPLISLDSLGIYGSHIWVLWKDVCHHDPTTMMGVFRAHQLGFVSQAEIHAALSGGPALNLAELMTKVRQALPAFGLSGSHVSTILSLS